jgi:hypothetical protein
VLLALEPARDVCPRRAKGSSGIGRHAAAKRPDNEFRGANLQRRSIKRIERLGVGGTDALGGDARLRGAAADQNLSPNHSSNASNLAVASWPVGHERHTLVRCPPEWWSPSYPVYLSQFIHACASPVP